LVPLTVPLTAVSMLRRLAEIDIPQAPPCFGQRQWLEYMRSASEAQTHGKRGPILLEPGQAARLDTRWSFCKDCPADYRTRMAAERRCLPDWLRREGVARIAA
jgi:hypothetical protein